MPNSTLTTIPTSPAAAPTQGLRDLIDAVSWGGASLDELHNALNDAELRLGLPLTTATGDSEDQDVAA